MNQEIRIAFAGDRDISVKVLKFIIDQGVKPVALLVADEKIASHDKDLINLCDDSCIMRGAEFRTKENMDLLRNLDLDYIISVHFHYIFPEECLKMAKHGVLNLHPAYLPYNKGWHTPSWSILDETPFGATLHYIDKDIDNGDIILQEQIEVLSEDTADSVYKKVKELEFEVFKKSWPSLVSKMCCGSAQNGGTCHVKKDLLMEQAVDLNKEIKAGDLIRKLRALTTNNIEEAAYFEKDGKKYRMQIIIKKEL